MEKYKYFKSLFDNIIDIPWIEEQRYAVEHRWKLYHISPYEETVVLDTNHPLAGKELTFFLKVVSVD